MSPIPPIHPFTITPKIVNYISEISILAKSEYNFDAISKNLKLRKKNRTRSIYSSLAIENNALNPDEVEAVINGKKVIGPIKDIQEVKNADSAYLKITEYDPYSLTDLLTAHRIMMDTILNTAGELRQHNEAVYENDIPIHIAPSPEDVPYLLKNLLSWCKETEYHPLIVGAVFHYEFEFIHPFADGNGRTGRLWQTVILTRWDSLFQWLPVESMIYERQNEYYEIIKTANTNKDSTQFIEFILQTIKDAFRDLKYQASDAPEDILLRLLAKEPGQNVPMLAKNMNKSEASIKRYLTQLKNENRVHFVGSPKTGGYYLCDERNNMNY